MIAREKSPRAMRSMIIGAAVGVVGLLVSFATPDFPNAPFLVELLIKLGGFFVFFFGFGSSVGAGLRYIRPARTSREDVAWELKRSQGKRAYVTAFVATGFVPSVGALAILFWIQAAEV